MPLTTIIGLLATLSIVISQVPQVYKTLQTRKTRDLSELMLIWLIIGQVLWIAYGWLRPDWIIILSGSFVLTMLTLLLIAKLKYK